MGEGEELGSVTLLNRGEHLQHHPNVGIRVQLGSFHVAPGAGVEGVLAVRGQLGGEALQGSPHLVGMIQVAPGPGRPP
jgi:hypothetical protein